MAKSAAEVAPARPWFPRRTFAINWRRMVGGHAPPLALLLAATLWLTRGLLVTSQLPAGTDMLGFVSRSAQNATVSNALSLWTPTSLGYPRTWSLDNVMGALTILTGNPVVTVKLLDVLVIFATGASGYLLAWSWYRRRVVALVAGLLYMLSQAALSRWGSGQLNVAMAIALAPILLWSWSQCLQRFTVRRALTLALLVTGMLLIRLDMVLYVAPFMALYPCFAVPYARPLRPVRNALKTIAVALPAALALNIYQILPVVTGYGPKWLSSGQLFDLQQIATHTLSAYQSLLGFGREIGYLAFTGQQTWFSFPFLPLWAYYAVASVVVACAFLALAWEHGRRTIFLAVMAIVAVFLAKGSDPPFGNLYTWAINHIPIVSDIRDPNRWLIFEALALGIMAGITVDRILVRGPSLLARIRVPRRAGSVAAGAFALVLVAAMLLQVAPTIATGLKTWEPPADEVQLLDSLRVRRQVSSRRFPYDQSTMFVDTPSYSGYEHDLGYESPLFTGVPTLGTGDWDQRTSDYIAYTSTLLGAGDPAFARLLASVGVSDLVSLNEPIQAAQVLDAARGSSYQQTEAKTMSGLVPLNTNTGGTVYALPTPSPLITFRPNIAVVLGGRAELADFADLPGVECVELGGLRRRRPHRRRRPSAPAECHQRGIARRGGAVASGRARRPGSITARQAVGDHVRSTAGSRDVAPAVGSEHVPRRPRGSRPGDPAAGDNRSDLLVHAFERADRGDLGAHRVFGGRGDHHRQRRWTLHLQSHAARGWREHLRVGPDGDPLAGCRSPRRDHRCAAFRVRRHI